MRISRRRRNVAGLLAVGPLLVLAISLPGANASKSTLRTGEPNTLAEAQQDALAGQLPKDTLANEQKAMKGMKGMSMPGMKMSSTQDTDEAKAMAAMGDMTTAVTTVQGPTNLANNVGGSWNNYAFTIPNDPSCPNGVANSVPCPDGANGPSGAVHSIQLYNGDVLIMAGSGNQWENLQAGDFTSWLWDPTMADQSKAWKFIKTPWDMFCAGHTILPDGNVLVNGGTKAYPQYDSAGNLVHDWQGLPDSYVFNVATSSYVKVANMYSPRWYNTDVETGDGQVVTAGGLNASATADGLVSENTDVTEEYNPSSQQWTQLPSMDFSLADPSTVVSKSKPGNTRTFPYYPQLVLAADGRLFYSGESNGDNGIQSGFWSYKTGAFQPTGQLPLPYQRNAGSTVLLPPAQDQKVMVMGGGDETLPSTNTTAIINLSAASPKWTAGPSMSAAKMYVGGVILPDYTVFETNGASAMRVGGVHTAEDYSPTTNKWTVMNSPTIDRLYHSEAFLEPNGQVAVLGSQPLDASYDLHISIYSPPYLYKTARPTITGLGLAFNYSGSAQGKFNFTTASGTTLSKVSLIMPSATTHSVDPNQRLVNMGIVKNSDGTYSLVPPTNDNIAPPGQYMMFALDSNGVPSVAKWVSIGTPFVGSVGSQPTPSPSPSTTSPSPSTTSPSPSPSSTGGSTGTSRTLALSDTMSGWEGHFTVLSSSATSGQDITLQELENGVWTKVTNNITDATGKTTFTWGNPGGTTFSFRCTVPVAGSLTAATSNTVSVTYGP